LPLSDVWLEAPVQRPGKLITIGVNYLENRVVPEPPGTMGFIG
jgi:hypothetical protein